MIGDGGECEPCAPVLCGITDDADAHLPLAGRFKCPQINCDKTYLQYQNLSVHERTAHRGERYICTYPGCAKSYTTASHLAVHQRSAHLGERFACTQPGCAKSYTTPSHLAVHQRSAHLGERYTCPHPGCSKTYSEPSGYARHKRTAHIGEWCECRHPSCGKSAATCGHGRKAKQPEQDDATAAQQLLRLGLGNAQQALLDSPADEITSAEPPAAEAAAEPSAGAAKEYVGGKRGRRRDATLAVPLPLAGGESTDDHSGSVDWTEGSFIEDSFAYDHPTDDDEALRVAWLHWGVRVD
jgi:hypothetical protein